MEPSSALVVASGWSRTLRTQSAANPAPWKRTDRQAPDTAPASASNAACLISLPAEARRRAPRVLHRFAPNTTANISLSFDASRERVLLVPVTAAWNAATITSIIADQRSAVLDVLWRRKQRTRGALQNVCRRHELSAISGKLETITTSEATGRRRWNGTGLRVNDVELPMISLSTISTAVAPEEAATDTLEMTR